MAKPLQESPANPGIVFLPTTLFVNVLTVQQHQMQAMIAWQQSMADIQQDLYDRWACQWAGGARLND